MVLFLQYKNAYLVKSWLQLNPCPTGPSASTQTSFVNLWYVTIGVVDVLKAVIDDRNGFVGEAFDVVVDDHVDVVVTLDGKDDDFIAWVVVVQGDLEMILLVVTVLFNGVVVE